MKKLRFLLPLLMLTSVVFVMDGCKNKKPSLLKVFVRSSSNELLEGAMVTIIGDVNSNPATASYVDTLFTNSSGFAQFDLEELFTKQGKDNTTGYLDIVAKKTPTQGTGRSRVRAHITGIETVFLIN